MSDEAFLDRVLPEIEAVRVDPGPYAGAHAASLAWLFDKHGDSVPRHGLWCEFGVFQGGSLRFLAPQRVAARLVGFDSFTGLPEDWRPGYPAGTFNNRSQIPHVDGAEMVPGLFADTLPGFDDRGVPLTFLHVDCDIYSSARCVLEWAQPRLSDGSVIMFDELVGYPEFREHEMKALYEAYERGLRWKWLGAVNAAVAIRVV